MKPLVRLLVFVCFCRSVLAADRVALVIGNGAYQYGGRLANPVNDADAFADKLVMTGFAVQRLKDGSAREMVRSITQFSTAAKGASFAIFYYAGHGIEISADGSLPKNYLLPVDAQLEAAGDEKVDAVALQTVLDEMKGGNAKLKVVILDCCRNNPFSSRSWLRSRGTGGLAEVSEKELPEGTMIVFAGSPGKTVPDGSGSHSPFTTALLESWKGGLTVPAIITSVVDRISESEPWIRFDGSGKTFAAFHGFKLSGETGSSTSTAAAASDAPPSSASPRVPAVDARFVSAYTSSSQLRTMSTRSEGAIQYDSKLAFDGDKSTAWVEGAPGTGAGEWIAVEFSQPVTLSAVSILPGYGKNADIFAKNGKVKRLEMTLDGEETFTLNFEVKPQYHRFPLKAPTPVRTIRFRILEAIHGSKYDDTAISDILFE